MKYVIAIIPLFVIAYFMLYTAGVGDYDMAKVEQNFQTIGEKGFDESIISDLEKQYMKSDASYRLHFLAHAYKTYKDRPELFENTNSETWTKISSEVLITGEAAYNDWFENIRAEQGS